MTANQIKYRETINQDRAARAQEALTASRDAETKRANLARELETNRSNVARETEQHRANVAQETETNRSNLARELETNRSNLANEAIAARNASSAERNAESNAQNAVTNRLQYAVAQQQADESKRSHLADELERNRHNVASETQQKYATDVGSEATKYSADQRYASYEYSADKRSLDAALDRYSANERTQLTNETNLALEQLKQEGLNDRQARQILADALYVLHNDVKSALTSDSGKRTIKDMLFNWTLKRLTGGK